MVKKIVIASKNPIKVDAVRNGFERLFPDDTHQFVCVSVRSDVTDQPLSDQVARIGASNRAQNAREAMPDADFWVGVEGGCDYLGTAMIGFAWIVVLSGTMQGSSRTAHFQLPPAVQALVESGLELGEADDRIFGKTNSKQKTGAVGLLTGDILTRASFYEQAVILALIPFKNPTLYG